jgi:hypothetical protein
LIALSLVVNITLGCAGMIESPSQQGALSSSVTMADSHCTPRQSDSGDDKKSDHEAAMFCKAFCGALASTCIDAIGHEVIAHSVTPNVVFATASWDSSVDPPRPRIFNVRA